MWKETTLAYIPCTWITQKRSFVILRVGFLLLRDLLRIYDKREGNCDKFYLPSNFKFECCEFKLTKYFRGTKYLFTINQTSKIWIPINQRFSKWTEYKWMLANCWKSEITIAISSEVIIINQSKSYFTIFICKYTIQILLNRFKI